MNANCVLFSGGRTSGFMLRSMLDDNSDYRDKYITIFCNTGKERSETLDFVHEVETKWDVPVVWLEYTRISACEIPPGIFPTPRRNTNLAKAVERGDDAHWFKVVDYETANRDGKPFEAMLSWAKSLPNPVSRVCSTQLKIRTSMRYLFSLGIKQYSPSIGIRADEAHRSIEILASCDSYETPKFPLIEGGIIESNVNTFWKFNDFDLRLKNYEGNCDLCFLKAKWKRIQLIKDNPDMPKWWKDQETNKAKILGAGSRGAFFQLGNSYEKLEKMALRQNLEQELELDFSEQDIPCSCAERGFVNSDKEEV